jgi:hypothetical protein
MAGGESFVERCCGIQLSILPGNLQTLEI